MSKVYFITGTDTDCGKTLVASAILHRARNAGCSTAAVKPLAAGANIVDGELRNDDALCLQHECSPPLAYRTVNPVCFAEPIAPHIAAASEQREVSIAELAKGCRSVIDSAADITVVEGAGGWLVPVSDDDTLADLAVALSQHCELAVILVVRMKLGALNHALLTAAAVRQAGLTLAGWVANCPDNMPRRDENIESLHDRLPAPCLGQVPRLDEATAAIAAGYIDWPFAAASQESGHG